LKGNWFHYLFAQVLRACDGPRNRDVELIWVEFLDSRITLASYLEFCNGMKIIILTTGQEFMRRVLSLTSCGACQSHDAIIFK